MPAKNKTSGKDAKGAKAQAKKPETQEVPKQPRQNGVTRPRDGTKTGQVWAICDRLSKEAGGPPARAGVMKAGQEAELNPATVSTQYGRWRKFHNLGQYAKQADKAEAQEETPDAE